MGATAQPVSQPEQGPNPGPQPEQGPDPGPQPEQGPDPAAIRPGPQDALRRHRGRTRPALGRLYLEQLDDEEAHWLEGMVTRAAAHYRVDAGDLYQELALGLLECDVIDLGRAGLHRWLEQRARWKASDMLRAERRDRFTPHDHDQLTMAAAAQTDRTPTRSYLGGVAHQHPWIDPDRDLRRLRSFGLSHDEAQVVLLTMWGLDISLKDFAELADRNYAQTRKQKERGLKGVRAALGLTAEQEAVVAASRHYGSAAAAAEHLGISEAELAEILARATSRILRVLEQTKDEPDVD